MAKPREAYTGGPAFPIHPRYAPKPTEEGMTLRDYYAGQALVGLLANFGNHQGACNRDEMVYEAFILADTMVQQAVSMSEIDQRDIEDA